MDIRYRRLRFFFSVTYDISIHFLSRLPRCFPWQNSEETLHALVYVPQISLVLQRGEAYLSLTQSWKGEDAHISGPGGPPPEADCSEEARQPDHQPRTKPDENSLSGRGCLGKRVPAAREFPAEARASGRTDPGRGPAERGAVQRGMDWQTWLEARRRGRPGNGVTPEGLKVDGGSFAETAPCKGVPPPIDSKRVSVLERRLALREATPTPGVFGKEAASY